ncbi:glycoside hydrolase family 16 protein [Saccharothrix sp. DSM 118769]
MTKLSPPRFPLLGRRRSGASPSPAKPPGRPLPRFSPARFSLPRVPLSRFPLILPVVVVVVAVAAAVIALGTGDRGTGAASTGSSTAVTTRTAPGAASLPSSPPPSGSASSTAPAQEPPVARAPGQPVPAPVPCGRFFDDFRYSSSRDGRLGEAGWTARGDAGGPGPQGAAWSADNITFPVVDGEQVAQLSASTDGTAAGTSQAELFQGERRFREGTYATRVRFADAPVDGEDGDHIMQAYLALSPAKGDYDPLYSQLSFTEYTPNGAWGGNEPLRSHASFYTLRADPYDAKQAVDSVPGSAAGWHTLVVQAGGGHVRYHLDGVLVADHTVDQEGHSVLPRQDMALHYNSWFVDLAGHRGGRSTYVQQVDWTYYAQDAVLSPADVVQQAAGFRSGGVERLDTLRGAPSPCTG